MENIFKAMFGFAVFVFCLVVIGFFLLTVKIILFYRPEITLFGLTITRTIY